MGEVKFAGLNILSTAELEELHDAIAGELAERERQYAKQAAKTLANTIKDINHAGFSVVFRSGHSNIVAFYPDGDELDVQVIVGKYNVTSLD